MSVMIMTILVSGLCAYGWTTPLMEGTVGKYRVKMKLDVNDDTGQVGGWYYYASKGPKSKITLSGKGAMFDEEGTVLVEKVKGQQTGKFVGTLWMGSSMGVHSYGYSGTWISPAGKRLEFEVSAME